MIYAFAVLFGLARQQPFGFESEFLRDFLATTTR